MLVILVLLFSFILALLSFQKLTEALELEQTAHRETQQRLNDVISSFSNLESDRINSPLQSDRINSPLQSDRINSPLQSDRINSPLQQKSLKVQGQKVNQTTIESLPETPSTLPEEHKRLQKDYMLLQDELARLRSSIADISKEHFEQMKSDYALMERELQSSTDENENLRHQFQQVSESFASNRLSFDLTVSTLKSQIDDLYSSSTALVDGVSRVLLTLSAHSRFDAIDFTLPTSPLIATNVQSPSHLIHAKDALDFLHAKIEHVLQLYNARCDQQLEAVVASQNEGARNLHALSEKDVLVADLQSKMNASTSQYKAHIQQLQNETKLLTELVEAKDASLQEVCMWR